MCIFVYQTFQGYVTVRVMFKDDNLNGKNVESPRVIVRACGQEVL